MLRKQFMLTEMQANYLCTLANETGESQGHFVREAIEDHLAVRGEMLARLEQENEQQPQEENTQ
jgi:predicted DNA-binding protein